MCANIKSIIDRPWKILHGEMKWHWTYHEWR